MFTSALQVGPGIVERGKLDISERDLERPKYFRTFVATCATRTLIGASQAPMHLHTLGKRLLAYLKEMDTDRDKAPTVWITKELPQGAYGIDAAEFFG